MCMVRYGPPDYSEVKIILENVISFCVVDALDW